ncbi:MAG TPA: hypothetical protein VHQ42_06075 [Candidatus Limnocylindria bacterium]|nr:hypothetical protein [Candidatus Limnocylindria bacterium]
MTDRIRVALEVAPKRSFATAIDWPGWSRAGKTPEAALQTLLAYGIRYAPVAERAGQRLEVPGSVDVIDIIERLEGGSGTEFGVPGVPASAEGAPVDAADLGRLTALLRAAWETFDNAAAAAVGVTLRLGPRGGGRSLDKVIGHVRDAEVAYLGQLGARPPDGAADPADGMDRIRAAFLEALRARVAGEALPNPRRTKNPWSPRYAVRRSAWHALDHAWELEDRSTPAT